jgi:hypothetical protein
MGSEEETDTNIKLQIFQQIHVTIIRTLAVNFRKETQLKLYKIMAIPSPLHGSECWIPTEGQKDRLEAAEMYFLTAVAGH